MLWAGLGIAIFGAWHLAALPPCRKAGAPCRNCRAHQGRTPVSLSEALARRDKGSDIEFDAVKVRGAFDHASERHKLASFEGSPGWQIITPFKSDEGIVVLVDRGVVPADLKDAAKRTESRHPWN